jgi:hypothetical protein
MTPEQIDQLRLKISEACPHILTLYPGADFQKLAFEHGHLKISLTDVALALNAKGTYNTEFNRVLQHWDLLQDLYHQSNETKQVLFDLLCS